MTTKAKPPGAVQPADRADQRPAIHRPTNSIGSSAHYSHRLNRMFRLRDLPEFVGLGRTQITELIKAGNFPQPVPLSDSGRAVAWLECDLVAWQNARIAARNAIIAARDKTKVKAT